MKNSSAPIMEVVEPRCRICRDPGLRRLVNQALDWRGVPIPEGDKTYQISYRLIRAWINKERPYADPISYDSLRMPPPSATIGFERDLGLLVCPVSIGGGGEDLEALRD